MNSIKRKLCLKISGGVAESEEVMPERAAATNCTSCSCNCGELSTDVEGIKLDLVIAERRIQSNKYNMKRVGDILGKIHAENDEIRQKFDNYKTKVSEDLLNHTISLLLSDYSNSINTNQQLQDYGKNNMTVVKNLI